jgi:hypothetical protein
MRLHITLAAIAAVALTGCATDTSESTGARLSVDYFGDTDVVGLHFEIERVSCDSFDTFEPFSVSANADLVDGIFPGMIDLVEQSLDPDSRHLGSDFFLSLEPGCYDIDVVPAASINGDAWTPSTDCGIASADGVEVLPGQTAEATLISQCVGDAIGALDTLVLLNHGPTFILEIDEKFNYECESVNVCVTAYDVDDDPLEFEWQRTGGPAEFAMNLSAPEVIGFESGHRIWQQCTEIVTRWTASYDFEVTVYDLGYSSSQLVRIENMVEGDSHTSLEFPIHTNWIEDPLCFDSVGDLVPAPDTSIVRYAGCSYTSAESYYCSGNYPIDPAIVGYLCDGNDLNEEALYPDCD